MKCLLFGASGLMGSHLIPLLEGKYQIISVKRHHVKNDGTCSIDLEKEWSSIDLPESIDSVVYLAQSEKFRSFPESAKSIFRVNTLSLLKALNYARCAGARTFVYASSGGVYDNTMNVCEEEAPLKPHGELGFYLGTKMCGEIIAENYASFMNIIILRPFFVYGPGQRKDMLIPRLVNRVKNKQPIQLVGEDGLEINPTYVEDAVRAIYNALNLNMSCKVNIGGPEVLSMRNIGEIIGHTIGKKVLFEASDGAPSRIVGSIEKMSQFLWKPQITFAEGIKRYVEYIDED